LFTVQESRVFRKRLAELLGGPRHGWMSRDGDMHDASALMREDDEGKQEPIRCGRDDEEIGGHDLADVIVEESGARSGTAGGCSGPCTSLRWLD
jgi:hypothetical protein